MLFGEIFASLSSILIGQNPDEILPPPADIRWISGGGISNFPARVLYLGLHRQKLWRWLATLAAPQRIFDCPGIIPFHSR